MKLFKLINSVPDLSLLFSLVLAFVLDRYAPVLKIIPSPANLIGWLVIGIGLAGIVHVMAMLKHHHTSTNPVDMPAQFLTDGMFSISRNPLYLSYVIVVLGAVVLLGSLTALLAPLLCFLVIHFAVIPIEERKMNEGFGSAYRAYREKVRRWI